MKRTPMRPRAARLARGSVKTVNRARKQREWVRAYGSPERVQFVAGLPCACGCPRVPCENAHVVKGDGGTSYKASARFIAPLAAFCHRLLHTIGPVQFQAMTGADLAAAAARTEAQWRAQAA